ncbi:Hypothetical predicted protein [Cloeon dipterum]|uniref:Uncharacterized protein n=1 Tax=Cloeon dipterum TaxID=197152 RepID=A0A8S1BL22_9INSE|nr:Hypothetical predicted protein [Cloeon dipterum]
MDSVLHTPGGFNSDSDADEPVHNMRRFTRRALMEVSSSTPLPVTPEFNTSSFPTPSPSPDELIIQLRGRRKLPVTWSPDVKRSPIKLIPGSPNQSGIVLRSTPRKRLLLFDEHTPEKSPRKTPSPSKRKSVERLGTRNLPQVPLSSLLKGQSKQQLINLLLGVIESQPDVEQMVRDNLSFPDLELMEEQLSTLKGNIFKCFPGTRLTERYDAFGFARVCTHLNMFKKAVIDHGNELVDSKNYGAVIEYAEMAWKYVSLTPTWESDAHNTIKRSCFKNLASKCMTAIKNGNFTQDEYQRIEESLKKMVSDSDEIRSCLKKIAAMRPKPSSSPTK